MDSLQRRSKVKNTFDKCASQQSILRATRPGDDVRGYDCISRDHYACCVVCLIQTGTCGEADWNGDQVSCHARFTATLPVGGAWNLLLRLLLRCLVVLKVGVVIPHVHFYTM